MKAFILAINIIETALSPIGQVAEVELTSTSAFEGFTLLEEKCSAIFYYTLILLYE